MGLPACAYLLSIDTLCDKGKYCLQLCIYQSPIGSSSKPIVPLMTLIKLIGSQKLT